MPPLRPKPARRRASRRPRRDQFIGFRAPGQHYEGRVLMEPRTCLSACGGNLGYSDGDEYEPEEMRVGPR